MSRLSEITRYIVAEFAPDVSPDALEPDFDLLENGVVDSLGLLRLIAWVGDRFGVPVDDIDLAPSDFSSVAAIDALIESTLVKGPVP